jgi:hypothetical protein
LGFGFWGLGFGVVAQPPNPQSPIPNPQSPIYQKIIININIKITTNKKYLK